MRSLFIVLEMKARALITSATVITWQSVLKNGSSVIIFGGFAVAVFLLTRTATAYLLQEAEIGQFLFHRFLSMLLYVFFITVNVGNMIVSYSTLYRSQEVSFLMTLPLSHEQIFLVKFLDNFFYSSSTLALVGLAVLLGYGSTFQLPWTFYFFTIFLVLVPFMLIAGLLAVLMLMALIRIASRIGFRWLLAIVVVFYLGAVYVYFKVVNPVNLVQEVMRNFPYVDVYFGNLDPPFVRYLPNFWVSEFFYWAINGQYDRALPYLVMLIGTAAALAIIAVLLGRRYYYSTWLAASDVHSMGGDNGRRFRFRPMELHAPEFLPPQAQVLLRRDFWVFFREPSQWLHMLLMMVLMVIFLVSVSSLDLRLNQPMLRAVAFLIVFLFDGFLVASLSLRFVFPQASLEGNAFWSVRSAPVTTGRLYWHKLVSSLAIIIPVGVILAVASTTMLRHHQELVFVAAVASACVAVTLTSLNLAAGSYFAVYSERNPIRIASSQGASLTFLASMGYLSMVVAVLVMPLVMYFQVVAVRGVSPAGWMWPPIVAITAASILITSTTTTVGLRSLRRDF